MKKKLLSLLLALAMCLSLSVPAFAVENTPPLELEAASTATLPESDENIYYFIDPALESANTRSGSDYLYSYYSFVQNTPHTWNSSPEINHKFIISVANGKTATTTATVTTSGSIKFSSNVETEIKEAIRIREGANVSFVISFSVSRGTTYTFPAGETGNSVSFYIATGFDKFNYTYARYDVYQGETGGLGVGLEHRFMGNVSRLAEIPKKVSYSVVNTVG